LKQAEKIEKVLRENKIEQRKVQRAEKKQRAKKLEKAL
jgi:hypothetical protein